MLKGRRSSTPSQKEKEKSSDKLTKKQQRSVSTSAIKGNNTAAANLTSLSFSSYTTQLDSQDNSINNNNNSSNNNNGHAVENGDSGHWIDRLCETVVLVLNESGGLHFEVGGGADEGKFPFIGRQRMKPEEAGISVQSLSQNGEKSDPSYPGYIRVKSLHKGLKPRPYIVPLYFRICLE